MKRTDGKSPQLFQFGSDTGPSVHLYADGDSIGRKVRASSLSNVGIARRCCNDKGAGLWQRSHRLPVEISFDADETAFASRDALDFTPRASTHAPMSNDMRVADVWANYWDVAYFKTYPQMQHLYDRLGMPQRAAVTAKMLRDEAAAGGVSRIVLSATDFPGTPVDNRKIAEVIAEAPDLLVGCASVDPRRGMEGVRELRRAVTEDGMIAYKVLPFLYGAPSNDAIYYPFYAACVDLGIPALVLAGHTAVMEKSDYGRPLYLDDVALYFRDLTIVAGHAGFPWTDELIGLAWKHEKVFIDTSGHRPKYLPPALKHFLNSYGRDKVLFGTGYPFMDYARPVADVREMDLRPESRDAFLWGNAARLWGWT